MTTEKLVTVPQGTTLDQAKKVLQEHRIEKLLVVDKTGSLAGLITVKDIQKKEDFPHACKDKSGRLRVGAALSVTSDFLERAQELHLKEVDVIVVDTAHGHSAGVLNQIRNIKKSIPVLIVSVLNPILIIATNSILLIAILVMLLFVDFFITLLILLGLGSISLLFLKYTNLSVSKFGEESLNEEKNSIQNI